MADPTMEVTAMCFCLLPVTGFKFEFCFVERTCGLVNVDNFMRFLRILTVDRGFK